jgi:hypothetical protein
MPDYVITARAAQDSTFGDNPGPTLFLEVPEGAETIAPSDAVPRQEWVRKVVAKVGRKRDETGVMRGDVLVFIHGYDNEPPIVLQRHRRLQADLPHYSYTGAVVSFDWPAKQVALAYLEDREKAKLTAFRLVKDCIELFARMQSGADCDINVHLLAHSTGAYVVREAFDDADDRRAIAAVNWTASQIAFIGADVSAVSMAAGNPESESIYRHCVRLTNYANPFDEVLQISNVKRAGAAPRAGRIGLPPDAPKQAVNIDCGEYYQAMIKTRPKESIIGYASHSWHIGDPVFTEDLAHTLNGDLDRSAIRTRLGLPSGQFKLVKPQTLVATAASNPVSVTSVT